MTDVAPTLTPTEDMEMTAAPSANSSGAENRSPELVEKSPVFEDKPMLTKSEEITLDDEDDCETIEDDSDENVSAPPAKRSKSDDDEIQCVGDNIDETKEKERERTLKRAMTFIGRFAETVEGASKPVCAVDDLRLTDVFSRFVEYQCSGNLAATIDVIKSTHVRFPSHVSVPPSQVVGLLAQYEAGQSVRQLKTQLFGHTSAPVGETEKKDKQTCRQQLPDRAPAFAYATYSLGLDLVQEKVYSDVVDGKHMNFFAKSAEQYKSVCEQLTPIVNGLRERNAPFKTEVIHSCGRCRFKAVSAFMIHEHRRQSHVNSKGYYVCVVCDFNSKSKEDDVLREHLKTEHHLEMVDAEPDLSKYPCPCCEEGFRWKGELVDHLRLCKREERTRIVKFRLDKSHLPLVNQIIWPRARTEQTNRQIGGIQAASKMPLIPGEAPLAGECSMPNGAPATLCVQLGGPDGAFALIKRPLPADPSRQGALYGMKRPIGGQVTSSKYGGMATNQLQQQVARQRQLQALAQQQQYQKGKNAPMFSNVNGMATIGGSTMAQVRNAAAAVANDTPSSGASYTPEQSQQLYMHNYHCEICDSQLVGLIRYLRHMQASHNQMKRKTPTDILTGPPLSCSRCRERFYTYEGLERHLALDHSLVTGDLLAKAKNRADAGRCKICAKMYAFNFLSHLVTEHKVTLRSAEIDYTCDVCDFSCNSYNQLDAHVNRAHPTNSAPILPPVARQKIETIRRPMGQAAPGPASKTGGMKKAGNKRYTCTPCSLRFDEYKQVINHWMDNHLKKSHITLCRIDECETHRALLEEENPSMEIDWEVPENTDGWTEGDGQPEQVPKSKPAPMSVKAARKSKAVIMID